MIILRQRDFSNKSKESKEDEKKKTRKTAAVIAASGAGLTALGTGAKYLRDSKISDEQVDNLGNILKRSLVKDADNRFRRPGGEKDDREFLNILSRNNYGPRGKFTFNHKDGSSYVEGLTYDDTLDFINRESRTAKRIARDENHKSALKKVALPGLAITGAATGAYLLHRRNKKKREEDEEIKKNK